MSLRLCEVHVEYKPYVLSTHTSFLEILANTDVMHTGGGGGVLVSNPNTPAFQIFVITITSYLGLPGSHQPSYMAGGEAIA